MDQNSPRRSRLEELGANEASASTQTGSPGARWLSPKQPPDVARWMGNLPTAKLERSPGSFPEAPM